MPGAHCFVGEPFWDRGDSGCGHTLLEEAGCLCSSAEDPVSSGLPAAAQGVGTPWDRPLPGPQGARSLCVLAVTWKAPSAQMLSVQGHPWTKPVNSDVFPPNLSLTLLFI